MKKNIYKVRLGDMVTYRVGGDTAYGVVVKLYLNDVGVEDIEEDFFIIPREDILEIGTIVPEELMDEFHPLDMVIADKLSAIMPLEFWCIVPIVGCVPIFIIQQLLKIFM